MSRIKSAKAGVPFSLRFGLRVNGSAVIEIDKKDGVLKGVISVRRTSSSDDTIAQIAVETSRIRCFLHINLSSRHYNWDGISYSKLKQLMDDRHILSSCCMKRLDKYVDEMKAEVIKRCKAI